VVVQVEVQVEEVQAVRAVQELLLSDTRLHKEKTVESV
jgi:hypothetical protein